MCQLRRGIDRKALFRRDLQVVGLKSAIGTDTQERFPKQGILREV